ncbi:hypothetical protein LC593_04795 [Nostoc sp. CHAB 5844]|nr:hypothetical protein [Nostoc sp. CHAB 5844]
MGGFPAPVRTTGGTPASGWLDLRQLSSNGVSEAVATQERHPKGKSKKAKELFLFTFAFYLFT